jgi:cytoskeletal protein CcmA (bactofilin family)
MNAATPNQTVLSKGAVFDGKIRSSDSVRIDGELTGEVQSDAAIEVGESGVVKGNLSAKHVITAGRVSGSITAAEKVELKGTSRLDGDLVTVRLVIEDGAQFEGMCSMGGPPKRQEQAVAPESAKDAGKGAPGIFGAAKDGK